MTDNRIAQNVFKNHPALLSILAGVVLFPAVSMADHDVKFSEEVGKTKHNLSANPDVNATGTTQVCVFCHTPHGANPIATGQAPLWNRLIPDDTSYQVYNSPNFDQQDFGGIHRPKGVSLACLSCHDGSIALDSLINGPQSGGFLPANRGVGMGPGSRVPGINFIGGGLIEADGSFMEGSRDAVDVETSPESPYTGGIHDLVHGLGAGSEGAQPFPNLGRDLTDDHPIGMEVPCGIDAQFNQICRDLTSVKLDGGSDGTHVAFISRTTEKDSLIWPVEKRDRLRLYPSTEEPGRYFVECASCHNPHAPRVSFLRLPSRVPDLVEINLLPTDLNNNPAARTWGQRPNAGSAICLSCHEK